MASTVSPTTKTKEKGMKIMKSIVNIVQPMAEETVNIKFDTPLADSISTSVSARKSRKLLRKVKRRLNKP